MLHAFSKPFFLCLMMGAGLWSPLAAGRGSQIEPVYKHRDDSNGKKEFKFEVISMRLVGPDASQSQMYAPMPNGFTSQLSMRQVMMLAYSTEGPMSWSGGGGSTRVLQGPSWIDDWYVIDARVSDDDREAWRSQGNRRELFRSALKDLLQERCKLVVHEVLTPVDGLRLVVASKKGVTFKPSNPDSALPEGVIQQSGGVSVGKRLSDNRARWYYYSSTMDDLVSFLSTATGGPVGDMTGLTGRYDFQLQSVDSIHYSHEPDEMLYNWPSILSDLRSDAARFKAVRS